MFDHGLESKKPFLANLLVEPHTEVHLLPTIRLKCTHPQDFLTKDQPQRR